jgi:dihydrofolate synthase/folylpolyglutamate synthase
VRFPTYSSALEWLYARNQFSIKLGLESTRELLAALGNPERSLAFVHVAGTNGKGSVCAALAAMLPRLGYARVGLYTSPHLVSFRERIRVDGEAVPVAWVAGWLNAHIEILEALNPTYFEIVTAMALCRFREVGCEAVVLETGLGGRLDATNVVTPRATAITSISLDHTAILGDTLEAIQSEKLGIVKAGVPLVIDESRAALAGRAQDHARATGAPFLNLSDRLHAPPGDETGWTLHGRFAAYTLPADLRAEDYQWRNAALAVLALEAFHGAALPQSEPNGSGDSSEPSEQGWLSALRAARMPGRMQRIDAADHIPVLLDAAHNPAGAEALVHHLAKSGRGARRRIFFSAMRDKDVRAVARALATLSADLVFVDLSLDALGRYPRALATGEARALLPAEEFPGLRSIAPEEAALEPLLRPGSGADEAVICGSLFLLGEVIPLLARRYAGLEEFARLRQEDIGEAGN